MKTYIFNNPESVSERQFEQELLPLLPSWRKEQALKYKHLLGRVLCAEAFLLLKEGLQNDFGINNEITFEYINNGKPILQGRPDLHFNLSHCKKGILCVIDDKAPIGCDIEFRHRRINDNLITHCCNETEIGIIRKSNDPDAEFIRIWTIKEAVLKCTGDGIIRNLRDLLTPERLSSLEIETHVCLENDFVYSICRDLKKISSF